MLTADISKASKIFYVDTFATTIRAISGLSRQTPSLRMTKSAGSKTCPFTNSNTARSDLSATKVADLTPLQDLPNLTKVNGVADEELKKLNAYRGSINLPLVK